MRRESWITFSSVYRVAVFSTQSEHTICVCVRHVCVCLQSERTICHTDLCVCVRHVCVSVTCVCVSVTCVCVSTEWQCFQPKVSTQSVCVCVCVYRVSAQSVIPTCVCSVTSVWVHLLVP